MVSSQTSSSGLESDTTISAAASSTRSVDCKVSKDEKQVQELAQCVSQSEITPRYDTEQELGRVGKRDVWLQKYLMTVVILSLK
jgi:hypothetical protein